MKNVGRWIRRLGWAAVNKILDGATTEAGGMLFSLILWWFHTH